MLYYGSTDQGIRRSSNQDSYRLTIAGNLLIATVCDGMGGAKSGNVASNLALDVFVGEIQNTWTPGMNQEKIDQMLEAAVKLANFTVFDQAMQFEEFNGMGTTLVAVLIQEQQVTVINVGDSRAYLVSRSGIRCLTKDHSLVQMMVDRGELTPERARTYPGKNYITRAIGTDNLVESDIFHLDVDRGDSLLLCTAGLSNLMDDQEILFEVVHGVNKQYCCQRLLDIAKNRGAPDNVTSILVLV